MARIKLSQIVTGLLPYQNIVHEDAIVLVGRSHTGPSMIPIYGDRIDRIVELFGENSELTVGFLEARAMGGKHIYLIRMDGVHANVTWTSAENEPIIQFISMSGSDGANDLFFSTRNIEGTLVLQFFRDDKLNNTAVMIKEYVLDELTIGQLEERINSDAYILGQPMYAITKSDKRTPIRELFTEEIKSFYNGKSYSSLDMKTIHKATEEILSNLFGTTVRQIGFLYSPFMSSAEGKELIYQLYSQFTMEREESGNPCFINIGFENIGRQMFREELQAFVYQGFPRYNEYGLLYSDPQVRFSEYINIIAAKYLTNVALVSGDVESNGVAAYCGLIDTLAYGQTTTNKLIKVSRENLLIIEDDTIKRAIDLGYTVFSNNSFVDPVSNYRVLAGVNLLQGTGGVSYGADALTDMRVKYKKPALLGRFGNVLFISDFTRMIHRRIDEHDFDKVAEKDLVLIIEDVIETFKNVIRHSEYTIQLKQMKDYKEFVVGIDLILYGEVQNITIALTA